MSFLVRAISSVGETLQAGFRLVKDCLQTLLQLVRPSNRVKHPPQINRAVDDLDDRVVVISACQTVACPSALPMMAPPTPECLTGDLKKGSQSARALFLGSFRPLSPMGVFEISSNAFSPTTDDTQSPLSSSGDDSQYTAIFDPIDSPSQVSTAPTTPASDLFNLGPVPEATGTKGKLQVDRNETIADEDEDIPLSALMILGLNRNNAKRNGISGDLLSNRKDAPLWAPGVLEAESLSTISNYDDKEHWEEINISDGHRGGCLEIGIQTPAGDTDQHHLDPQPLQVDGIQGPVNPVSWCDAWVSGQALSNDDDESVYSLDSFVPRLGRASRILPQITLTPPSLPTSPILTPSNTINAMPTFEDACYSAPLPIADRTDRPCSLEASAWDLFKPSTLLVPLHCPVPRQKHIDCEALSGKTEWDEALIKRKRRNACRLNTSSIDIIMAGLDQEFPDTPITSPKVVPADFGDGGILGDVQPNVRLEVQESILRTNSYAPSSPSTTVRNSLSDLSGETLLFEEELESKFSDSSDEELEPLKIVTAKATGRMSWPISELPPFGPRSILSTIVEEEEDGSNPPSDLAPFGDSPLSLAPSAVIRAANRVSSKTSSCYRPTRKVSKKRWFSMIEDKSRQPHSVNAAKRKHVSAPALIRSNGRADSHLANSDSVGAFPCVSSYSRSSTIQEVMNRPRSIVRPLVGENHGVARLSSDLEDFSLPSSRSSSCLSLYQRPWSLYVPAEPVEATQTSDRESVVLGSNDVASSVDGASPSCGLGGILAILDNVDFSTAGDSTLDPAVGVRSPDESDIRWSYRDFGACSGDSAGSEFFALAV